MNAEWVAIGLAVFGIFFGIIGWLLSNKDGKQAKEIEILFALHKEDAEKLSKLELKIAEDHPDEKRIRTMFSDFKTYLDERFDRIEMAVGVKRRGGQ